ncbi:MAG: cytochrome c3 family protein [Desulfosarcinaceae bacterium]
MMARRTLQRFGFALLAAGLLLLAGTLTAVAVVGAKDGAKEEGRADILIIDGLKSFGSLQRPAVYFYHDKHTEALAKESKDCSACHPKGKKDFSLKFKRLEDADRETVRDIYHDNCISCHQETRQAGKASGPITCGQCHVENAAPAIDRRPIDLDKSLHYRHIKAMDKKCELCHHAYNEQTKKLYYDKGKEGACLYCHKEKTQENRISIRLASHEACVGCHQKKTAAKLDAGPLECSGCHDPRRQAMIVKLADVPRLERNQPDTVLVRTLGKDEMPADPPDNMSRVPFSCRPAGLRHLPYPGRQPGRQDGEAGPGHAPERRGRQLLGLPQPPEGAGPMHRLPPQHSGRKNPGRRNQLQDLPHPLANGKYRFHGR